MLKQEGAFLCNLPFITEAQLLTQTNAPARTSAGVLYSDFVSERQYVAARDYAQQLRVLVHDVGPLKRMFFVTADGHDVIRSYVGQLQAGSIGDE